MTPITELERLLARTWPGLEQDHLGDWLLRAGGGWTGRANSVLAVGDPGLPLEDALDRVADWYARRGLPPRVHVAQSFDIGPQGQHLLTACTRRGWAASPWTFVMTREALPVGGGEAGASASGKESGVEFEWADHPTEDWVSLVRGGTLPEVGRAVLTAAPAWYLTVRLDGEPVASGRAAPVEDWVVLGAIEVAPAHRRNGIGTLVTEALAARGMAHGATRAALQVEEGNAPAVGLYRALGYRGHHHYVYCGG